MDQNSKMLNNQNYVLWNKEKSLIFSFFLYKSLIAKQDIIWNYTIKYSYLIITCLLFVWIIYFFLFLHNENLFLSIYVIWFSIIPFVIFLNVIIKETWIKYNNARLRTKTIQNWNFDDNSSTYKVPKIKIGMLNSDIEWFDKIKWFWNFFLFYSGIL